MEGVLSSFETLAVRGEEGVSWDKAAAVLAIRGGILYDSAIIRLTAKLDSNLLVLNRHVALDNFTVDAVAVGGEEEEQDGGGGVLNFIQERIVGSKKSSKIKDSSEAAVMGAWEACRAKGYHGLHVLAKVTQASMPEPSKHRYTPGHYVEALLNGFRAYYKFQRHDPLFEEDALGLWGAGGGGCVEPVTVCYLVLAWRMAQRNTGRPDKTTSFLDITTTAAAAAAVATTTKTQKQGQKRAPATHNTDEGPLTPAMKRVKLAAEAPPTLLKEEEEVTVRIGQNKDKDKIPDVWYSPDITINKEEQQQPSPKKAPHTQSPSSPKPPSPQKVMNPPSPPQKMEVDEEDDLSNITFGFERPAARGRGRGRGRGRRTTIAAAPASPATRKSALGPKWSEEEKEELLDFFDKLNPTQTEQTCIALACKFATMRFGRDLSSKQLYQLVQQKGRTVHPPPDTFTLPGGTMGVRAAASDLFLSLNQEVSEVKRVAFTCRFLQTQYGAEIDSKELYAILSGKGKKGGRGGRGGGRGKV